MSCKSTHETWRSRVLGILAVIGMVAMVAGPPALADKDDKEDKKRCFGTADECLEYLARKMKTSGWVGVELEIDEKTGRITVQAVIPESPAATAGILKGDLLQAINGTRGPELAEQLLSGGFQCSKPGESMTYAIRRDGVDREIRLVLAPMPAEVLARYIGEHMKLHADREQPKK